MGVLSCTDTVRLEFYNKSQGMIFIFIFIKIAKSICCKYLMHGLCKLRSVIKK